VVSGEGKTSLFLCKVFELYIMKSKYYFKVEDLQVYQKAIIYGEFVNSMLSVSQTLKFISYQLNLLVPQILLHSILLKD